MISRSKAPILFVVPAVLLAAIALFLHPIPQPLSYHNFADHRAWLGIPNFGDVISNLPFAIVGSWGVIALLAPVKLSSTTLASAGSIWRCLPA